MAASLNFNMQSNASSTPELQPHAPRLGRPLRLYPSRPLPGAGWQLAAIGLLALLAIAAPLALAAWRFGVAFVYVDAPTALAWSWLWLALAGLSGLAGLGLAISWFTQKRSFVALHRGGIRWQAGLNPPRVLYWDQIEGLASMIVQERFLHLPVRVYLQATLFPTGRAPLRLPENLRDMTDLVQRLKFHLYPRLLPPLRERLAAGQPLRFGPITLEPGGLRLPGLAQNQTPWETVTGLEIQQGSLIVRLKASSSSQAEWQRPLGEIPNPEILVELADSLRKAVQPALFKPEQRITSEEAAPAVTQRKRIE